VTTIGGQYESIKSEIKDPKRKGGKGPVTTDSEVKISLVGDERCNKKNNRGGGQKRKEDHKRIPGRKMGTLQLRAVRGYRTGTPSAKGDLLRRRAKLRRRVGTKMGGGNQRNVASSFQMRYRPGISESSWATEKLKREERCGKRLETRGIPLRCHF